MSSTSSPKASNTKSSQKKPAKAPVTTGTKQEEEGVGPKGRGKKAKANRAAVENEPEKLPKEEENEGRCFCSECWSDALTNWATEALSLEQKVDGSIHGHNFDSSLIPRLRFSDWIFHRHGL